MKVKITNPTKTSVKAEITIEKPELEQAEEVALTKLAKDVKAPGFRKGNAPASVVKKHVSQSALTDEVLNTAINRAVADAFIENDIQVIERPHVDVVSFVPGQQLEITAESAIVPPVKLGDYKKLGIKKPAVKVEDSDVNEVLERLQKGYAAKEPVERAAKEGDQVLIDFVGKKDGVAFDGGTANDHELELGSNSFIPGFESAIEGHKTGESFDVKLSFPDDYHVEDLKGQPVVFETKLKEVREQKLPELNDEFAAKVGEFTSVEDLKADIKREITDNKTRQLEGEHHDELVKKLVEVSDVTAPEPLVNEHVQVIEQDVMQNLRYQNATLEQYIKAQGFKDEEEWRKKELLPAAENRVKSSLVLSELTKQEEVTATEEEVDQHVEMYLSQYGKSPEMQKQLAQPEVRSDIKNRLLTEKTLQRLSEINDK